MIYRLIASTINDGKPSLSPLFLESYLFERKITPCLHPIHCNKTSHFHHNIQAKLPQIQQFQTFSLKFYNYEQFYDLLLGDLSDQGHLFELCFGTPHPGKMHQGRRTEYALLALKFITNPSCSYTFFKRKVFPYMLS